MRRDNSMRRKLHNIQCSTVEVKLSYQSPKPRERYGISKDSPCSILHNIHRNNLRLSAEVVLVVDTASLLLVVRSSPTQRRDL